MQSPTFYRRGIFCILPPHILHEIAKRGTQAQRDLALDTLASDHPIRFGRATYQLMATGAHKLVTPAPATVEAHITIYDAPPHAPSRQCCVQSNNSTDPEVKEVRRAARHLQFVLGGVQA
jgi:hypothetical protein